MKDKKLNQLFAAARHEPSPAVPADFAERVQRSLAAEGRATPVVINFWDQLNRNFNRYAVAAAAMIMICAAVEVSQALSHEPSMDDDVEQICSDWMLR
jgi:hypothetical protein